LDTMMTTEKNRTKSHTKTASKHRSHSKKSA